MPERVSHLESGGKKAGTSPAGVPHEAHERLALPLREIREESNPASEIGGHPKWSGIFLDCGISRGVCNHSTPRVGNWLKSATAVPSAKASDLGFCSLRRQLDRVFQNAEELLRPQRVEWQ